MEILYANPYLMVVQVVNFILQIMELSNSVMRKTFQQTSMNALREVAHSFPMVAMNETGSRLAIGEVIGGIKSTSIRVYDLQRYLKTPK